ncbi:MAG: carboxymuconolactone decarboxylase family protein [Verrucomicrobiota bacterium]
MTNFQIHDKATAPDAAREPFEKAEEKFGMLPNILGIMAEAPPALKGYLSLSELFDEATLSSEERKIVLLAASFENGCAYCMAAHTSEAKEVGVDEQAIEAVRSGIAIDDARLQALREFTATVVRDRGHLAEDDVDAFLAAGYTQQNILEVILAVAMKTLSNYTNHIADTPLDAPLASFAWQPPV